MAVGGRYIISAKFPMLDVLVGGQGEWTLGDILIVCPGKYGGKYLGVNLVLRAVNGTYVLSQCNKMKSISTFVLVLLENITLPRIFLTAA
jgi:hypothetical protein